MLPNRDIKKSFLLFCKEHSEAVSANNESAKQYLKAQGKDPDEFANSLLKKIKKKQLENIAIETQLDFKKLMFLKETAIERAKELISSPGFSFTQFMKVEKFSLQNKNLETLNEDEKQNILEDYLFLKMRNANLSDSNDI